MHEHSEGDQRNPHDPWKDTLSNLESRFNPLEDQKQELLKRINVNDADLPDVDTFFDALRDLEEVWKGSGPRVDKEKMSQSATTLIEIAQRLESLNPQLSKELHTLHQQHIARLKAEGQKELQEHGKATAEQLRFGVIAEAALAKIEEAYPDTFPPGDGLLPEPLRESISRVIRPYYDALNRSYQDNPNQGETEAGRFEAYFWSQDQTQMLKELRAAIAQYYSSGE